MATREEHVDRATGRPRRARPRLGRPGRAAVRAPRPVARRDRRGSPAPGSPIPCFCTRREIQEAASAPHGDRAGRAPTRAPAATSPRRSRRRGSRPVGGRPCGCGPAARSTPSRTGCTGGSRARSTTSCCAATTASPPTTSSWWWTTPPRASTRSCGATTSSARRPGRSTWPGCSASPVPSYAHVPLVLGPDGARLAKRHGAVTLADRAAAGRVGRRGARLPRRPRSAWPAAGEAVTPERLLERFDPGGAAAREPLVLDP